MVTFRRGGTSHGKVALHNVKAKGARKYCERKGGVKNRETERDNRIIEKSFCEDGFESNEGSSCPPKAEAKVKALKALKTKKA